ANNTITVQGLQRSHASGEYVILALPIAAFNIQIVSASNAAYLGEDATVAANSTTLIQQLTAVGAFQYGASPTLGTLETQHLWLGGGPGVEFIPSFLTL